MNNFTGVGRIVRDVELRYLQSGQAITRFTIAIDKQLSKDKKAEFESQGKPTADFISCIAWGKQAEFIANYARKGGRVAVTGSVQTGSYEKEGQRVYTTDINVREVEIIDWKESSTEGFMDMKDGAENIPF